MNCKNAEKILDELDIGRAAKYEEYFNSIRPLSLEDKIRRGLFAIASVHVGWEANINLFAKLWDLKWVGNEAALRDRIVESKAGLVNGRLKSIMKFTALAYQFPHMLDKKEEETWYKYRDRISDMVLGLGPAKAAFFIELMHFHESRVVCMDTHAIQMYGVLPSGIATVKSIDLARMEMHWDMACKARGINPVTARWIHWDVKQGKPDSRYWSFVLEGKPEIITDQMELFTGEKSVAA